MLYEVITEGDTKTLPIIKKELLEKYAEQKKEELKAKGQKKIKETTDIGLYENERLRQVQAETEQSGAAAAKARKIVSGILFGIIFIIGALIVIFAVMNDKTEKEDLTQKLEVPDVEKMLVDEAIKIIKVNGFDYTIESYNFV